MEVIVARTPKEVKETIRDWKKQGYSINAYQINLKIQDYYIFYLI